MPAQDGFNAFAELGQLFLQDFVLGMVCFGGHIARKFIEFVESEVKHGALPQAGIQEAPGFAVFFEHGAGLAEGPLGF